MRKHILHPTDFSPGAEGAFARAVETARHEHGELILAHVLEGLMPVRGAYTAMELQVRTAVSAIHSGAVGRGWRQIRVEREADVFGAALRGDRRGHVLAGRGEPKVTGLLDAWWDEPADRAAMGTFTERGTFIGSPSSAPTTRPSCRTC